MVPIETRIRILSWNEAKDDAAAIREEVFVVEQNVPRELEMDAHDESCEHAIAFDENGAAVGTGRLLPDGHIGRMAVRSGARGKGLGSAILAALIDRARMLGFRRVVLHAQTHARSFYARHGFAERGDEFVEAGIPHVEMTLELG